MTPRLDHVAIAVTDLPEAVRRFVDDLGLTVSHTEDVTTEATRTAFLPVEGTRIELVQPMTADSALARSIATRGPGLHHLAFRTDDLLGDMHRLTARGYRFTSEEPKPGAHGTKVAFLHPKTTGGVLIELVEYP